MSLTPNKIHFIDLKAQQARIRHKIDTAIQHVLDHGAYILGPEVDELEANLSEFCGAKHSISCANGTDALALGLMAKQVQPGEAILVPSFTFAATAEVVTWLGAIPIFVDSLADTFNMDSKSLEQGIQRAKQLGLKAVGIIPVDLFGQPADYDAIESIAEQHELWIMADAAQSFGAHYKNRKVGTIGEIATTSFFPAKPLGCYGDGGAIFTEDDELATIIKSLRVHGAGKDRYDNVRIGMNGRLDTIQAAILIEKLKIFGDETIARNRIAQRYNQLLNDYVTVPVVLPQCSSVWAQYTIQLPQHMDRNQIIAFLKDKQIPTAIYYIKSLHQQPAYASFPTATGNSLEVCEQIANHVISLPMHAYLEEKTQDYIVENFIAALHKQSR